MEKKESSVIENIKKALDGIRPSLQMDGGDVEFVEFDGQSGDLRVRLKGACVGCPMSQVTLEEGVGKAVMEAAPEVKQVIGV
jgi:Fe-S cluster biogenesis protein NfuA